MLNGKGFTSSYSSIDLKENEVATASKKCSSDMIRLVLVANAIENNEEGEIEALAVIRLLKDRGVNASLSFIGDGSYIRYLKQHAVGLNIENNIIFYGRVSSRDKLMELLRCQDIFIFPSSNEGLPRAVIEAMACGLPCITSPVGGCVELIEVEYLVERNDIVAYGEKCLRLFENRQEYERVSKRNIQVAKKYVDTVLARRRKDFYMCLRSSVKNVMK